jgi:septal ring factor EnvC (AmiA/AmiB activator)
VASDETPNPEERRGTGEYRGPERRRCERGQYCTNVAEAKAETRVLEEKVNQQYLALHTRLDEFSDRLKDLPKEIAAQMEKEHRETLAQIEKDRADVDGDLDEGSEQFKKIQRQLGKIKRRQMLFWFLLAIALFGDLAKVVALFWPAVGKLIG